MKRVLPFLCLLLAASAALRADEDRSLYSSEQLVGEITSALQQHFRLQGELQLELQRPWEAPTRGAKHWDFSIEEYPGIPAANMLLRFRLAADGAVADERTVMVHASLWRDVWFAREPIATGAPFSPTVLDTRRADIFRERDALPATEGGDEYIFCRQLQPDHVVTWHDIAKRPLVHRGEVVDVVANEGRLSLTMKALAMETGARGDLVTVRNLESRRDIPAIVVGDDRVEVHF